VSGSDSISPTAHYTAAVWSAHGLSHPALVTHEGRLMRTTLWPTLTALRLLGGPALDEFLLARHRVIDARLDEAIASGEVGQVLEIAAGLSPRGWRYATRHGDALTYVEADLPDMARRKERALERTGTLGEHHRVVALDALDDDDLDRVAGGLDPDRGLAIVTEGLLNYFDRDAVEGLWARIAATLARFPGGVYLADLFVREGTGGLIPSTFTAALSVFVRGRVHVHFADDDEAAAALRDAGFSHATLHDPRAFGHEGDSAQRVRIIDAAP